MGVQEPSTALLVLERPYCVTLMAIPNVNVESGFLTCSFRRQESTKVVIFKTIEDRMSCHRSVSNAVEASLTGK